jgi:hypothetical protein
MAESKRTFIAGKMNQDIDERMLPDGQYRSASNITIEATGGSNMGAAQNALGNEKLFDVSAFLLNYRGLVVTGAKTIGAVKYEPLSLLYWFVTSDQFDGIFEYNQNSNTTYLILGSTTNQLNFDSLSLITGVNYIYSESGSYLFWTDNLNPPRRINISRVRGYSIDDSRINIDINVVLRPPLNSPSIFLGNDTVVLSNNLEEKFLYFSYRYKYIDNEFSSMSPFSSVAFNAKTLSFDPTTGDNIGMLNENNIVQIGFETGNQFVKEIQILARDTRSLNVVIIENLNKSELNIPDNSSDTFVFRNNKIYATLTSDQVTRMFDNVPLKALAQDIVGNRLIYGNYTQFRDVSDLKYEVDYINLNGSVATIANPKRTFRSDRDYEVGIVYSDEYGRLTTVLTSNSGNLNNNGSNSVFIPPTKSSTANSLITTIKSLPPSWATNYRLYIKQSKKDYYNLFPISFQVKGEYRYIQISESDRDKVSVGEYIIFKTANAVPTHTNKKFKVLEIELKAANDINTPSPAGLYLKIKPDAISASSFLAEPALITTTSPLFTSINNVYWISQIPYCFPANPINVHYDTVFYRGGSNVYTSSGNSAPSVTLTKSNPAGRNNNDVRLKVKIVPNPLSPNSPSATHYIINTNIDNQNDWLPALPIPNTPININTLVPISIGNIFLNFAVGNYQVGDVYVFNVRGMLAQPVRDIKSPRGNDGLPTASYNTYAVPAAMPAPSPNNVASPVPTDTFAIYNYGTLALGFSGKIYAGAIIKITVEEGVGCSGNIADTFTTTLPTASKEYPSFEEFFWEECGGVTIDVVNTNGTDPNKNRYSFRYTGSQITLNGGPSGRNTWINNPNTTQDGVSTYKSVLFFPANIQDPGCDDDNSSMYRCSATLEQAESPTYIVETVPLDVETPIFHETMKTYPIIGGFHKVGWQYSSNTAIGTLGLDVQIQLNSSYFHYFYVTQPIIIGGLTGTVYSIIDGKTITIRFPSTLPVGSGSVLTPGESDQSSSSDARVILNNLSENTDCNAFCYGNGLESYRIRDSFNNSTMKYSIRASTVIEDYEEEDKFASLCYSGIFRGDSSINRLNEFNLSIANFKNLDKDYGSIQKIYARDSDLLVLHEDKITSVLFGKNLLVDAVGGGQVASIPEVLGNQVPYQLDNGISNDPSSFAVNSDNIYFTDAKRGVVIEMIGNQGIMEISSKGMKNYFRDILTSNLNTQKIGAYDPYYNMYSLTTNDTSNRKCYLSISKPLTIFSNNGTLISIPLFNINSNAEWNIQLIDAGSGTNWLELNFEQGNNNSNITVNPEINSSSIYPREMTIRVHYCGSYVDHLIREIRYTSIVDSIVVIKPA